MTITREKAIQLKKSGTPVCFFYRGKTHCGTITSTRGSVRARVVTPEVTVGVPYGKITPKAEYTAPTPRPKRQYKSTPAGDENYRRSNAATIKAIPKRRLGPMHTQVKRMGTCLGKMRTRRERTETLEDATRFADFRAGKDCVQDAAQKLLDRLNDHYDIPRNAIRVEGTRTAARGGERYGFYSPRSGRITVYPYTKVKQQVVASKTNTKTTLHEWMHHFDTKKLLLNSIHTSGFGKRLKVIYDALKTVLE